MVSTLEQKFSESKDRIKKVQEDVTRRVDAIREDLWRKQAIATGRLRDESLQTVYNIQSQAFGQAAELLDRVPSLDKSARDLRERAAEAQQAEEDVARPPIANYDELNVKEVGEAIEGLDAWSLEKVRTYEEANKNRVTVLRAVRSALGEESA